MGTVTGYLIGSEIAGDQLVTHIPILHDGRTLQVDMLIGAGLASRVTEFALNEAIEDYEPEETPLATLNCWIGRFAIGELWDADLREATGWSSNYGCAIEGLEEIDASRELPHLEYDPDKGLYVPVERSSSPEAFKVERMFTPRVMGNLIQRNIIAAA